MIPIEVVVALIGAGGAVLAVVFAASLNASNAQLAALKESVKTLREDRDFYRGELRNSEKEFGAKVAEIEAKHDALHATMEAAREANSKAIDGLNETIDQLQDRLRESQNKRDLLETDLANAMQREKEMRTRMDQMEDQWAAEREQMQEKWNAERDGLQGQIHHLRDNLATLLQRQSLEVSNGKEMEIDEQEG